MFCYCGTHTQSDAALADLVQQYWVNFAATANPNTDDNQLTALYGKTALGVDVQWPAFVDSGSTVAQSLLLSSTGESHDFFSGNTKSCNDWIIH